MTASTKKKDVLYLQTLIDEPTEGIIYIGKSEVGRERLDEVWQIFRVEEVGTDVIVSYAEGTDDFKLVWDLRATYNYNIN